MRRLWFVLLLAGLIACGNEEGNNPVPTPQPSAGELGHFSLIDAETGEAIPGLEKLEEGSTLDLSTFGLKPIAFRTEGTSLSKVEFRLDGETYTDSSEPYSLEMEASDWRLASGQHTLSATPHRADGTSGSAQTVSFAVKAPDYKRYLYVFKPFAVEVFDIDQGHKRVKSIKLPPGVGRIWGAVAHAKSQRLYISFSGRDSQNRKERGIFAYDLVSEKLIWKHLYSPYVDSPAITKDGKTIYLSSGEATERGTFWFVLDTADGSIKDTIEVYRGAHNTIVGLSDSRVYMGSVRYPYLVVADTTTNDIVKKIGPFSDGVRPFTVNGKETLAFVNVNRLIGFEVGDIATGKVLYKVPVEGFEGGSYKSPLSVPSHGVALTPDEREVWVVNGPHARLHLYDVTGLPERAPRYLESIKLPSKPHWVQFSRDGRFAYTSGGEVIDAETRKVIAQTSSAKVRIQVDFLDDAPARAYVRYGLGYVTE